MGGWTEYCVVCGGPLAPHIRKSDRDDYSLFKWLDSVNLITEDSRLLRGATYVGSGVFKHRNTFYDTKTVYEYQGTTNNLCIALHSMCSQIVTGLNFETLWPRLGSSNRIADFNYDIGDYQYAIECIEDLEKSNKLWMLYWPGSEHGEPGYKNRKRIANLWKRDRSVTIHM